MHNIEYINKLKQIYPIPEQMYNRFDITTTDGEIEYDSIKKICSNINNENFEVFIDIGSGNGKMVLYMASCPSIKTSIGIEIVKERHKRALELKGILEKDFSDITKKIILKNKDMLQCDYNKLTNGKKTLIYISNLCFGNKLNEKIFNKLFNEISKGSVIYSSKIVDNTNKKNINVSRLNVAMSWSKNHSLYVTKFIG